MCWLSGSWSVQTFQYIFKSPTSTLHNSVHELIQEHGEDFKAGFIYSVEFEGIRDHWKSNEDQ